MRINKAIVWVGAALALASYSANADVFTFQPDIGVWNDNNNWRDQNNGLGTPGANDVAIIPAEKFCDINAAVVEAAAIQIDALTGPYRPAYIRIMQGSTLKLHGDATHDTIIDGVLKFLDKSGETTPATLIIMNDIAMDGFGSILAGSFIDATHVGVIKGDPGAQTAPVLTTTRDSDTAGLKIEGTFDIEVKLVNDGFVKARGIDSFTSKVMTLKGETKSGSGSWIAKDFGDLKVDVAVSGSGEWVVGDGINPGTIIINQAISGVSGDVTVVQGAFSATDNFCTTGNITWTGGKILVDQGATPVAAAFHVISCP